MGKHQAPTPSMAERAAHLIPGGTQTYSKSASQFPSNAPSHIVRGRGAHLWDTNGKDFVDWTMGLGAISLGYRDPDVDAAVREQLESGPIFGLAHPIEFEFAEELAPLMPWPDPMFRYGKNGSDATSAAVRAARAITGRERVISRGYHGWQDWSCPNRSGIPQAIGDLTVSVGLYRKGQCDLAAAIVEPDTEEDLKELRAWCDREGVLLIFDEVLTGFRYPGYTYAAYSGVTPDLICFGKAIANGFPLSVVAGPRKYMDIFAGGIGYSTTFGGETLSLAAGLATVRKYKSESVIPRLWEIGQAVQEHWEEEVDRLELAEIFCEGDPPRSVIRYPNSATKTLLTERMFAQGIMFTVGFTACYAHTEEDVARTNAAVTVALEALAAAGDHPETVVMGEFVGAPYRPR